MSVFNIQCESSEYEESRLAAAGTTYLIYCNNKNKSAGRAMHTPGNSSLRPNSRQRLSQLKKYQQNLSQLFNPDTLYRNDHLDLLALKDRIRQIRQNEYRGIAIADNNPENPAADPAGKSTSHNFIPLTARFSRLRKPKQSSEKAGFSSAKRTIESTRYEHEQESNFQTLHSSYRSKQRGRANQTPISQLELQEMNESRESPQEDASKQARERQFRSTMIPKIQSIGKRQTMYPRDRNRAHRQAINPSRLEPIKSWAKAPVQIRICTQDELRKFEQNILNLWALYEKLSLIMSRLSASGASFLNSQQEAAKFMNLLCQYRQLVCSNRYEFVVEMLDACLEFSQSRSVIVSRLLQNLSVVYIFLEIIEQELNGKTIESSHLVNFVGIPSHNILLLLRLFSLLCLLDQSLPVSEPVSRIFKSIEDFEIGSYKAQLRTVREVILRIEHNNELVSIVQGRLNIKMSNKDYRQGIFGKFLKAVIIDRLRAAMKIANEQNPVTKPLFEYCYFIFEYLAYLLHQEKFIGVFPQEIETVPAPYLPLPKEFTLVISPMHVLLRDSKSKVFVRPYTTQFLKELSQKCNIVYWITSMPAEADPYLDLIDIQPVRQPRSLQVGSMGQGVGYSTIRRLYRHHTYTLFQDSQDVQVKDISRIGCPAGKYLILDCDSQNYLEQDKKYVVCLPWKGQSKDSKLTKLMDLLLPYFRSGTDLSKGLNLLRPRLQELLRPLPQKKQFEMDQF